MDNPYELTNPTNHTETDVTRLPDDDTSDRLDNHISDSITPDPRTDTPQIEPDTVATEMPSVDGLSSDVAPDSSLTSNPDDVEMATGDEDEDTDDLTTRAAEATMNISLAALGDTIRQQIEGREQEVGQRLSLLYAQRAELTERLAATGDTAANTPSPQQGL